MIKKKRKLEREVAVLVLPVFAFFITSFLSILITITEQTGKSSFPLWVAYAILPQLSAGLIAFFITVDKDSVYLLTRCTLYKRGSVVAEYAVQPVIGGTGTIPRANPPSNINSEL